MASEFKLFAGPSTNTLTPTAWAALTTLLANGFQSGLANSQQANTLFRQVSTVAAGIGQFISDQGFDALDNGDIEDFAAAFSSALRKAALPSGIILMSGAGAAPAGAVKLNGAVISITPTTQSLVNAVYCGDGNNATASFFYKCTDAGNPTTSRSTVGTFFVLEDTRGRFPRSWVDGGAIDVGRSLWAYQAQGIQSHNHTVPYGVAEGDDTGTATNGQTTQGYFNTTFTGDTETRPVNFPCLFSITL